jgi:hypothetical protein
MELTTRLRAGFPNNPTPRKRLVEWRGRTLRGHHPLRHAHHSRGISGTSRHRERFVRLQFRGKPRIFKLGSSRFARRYSENPGWFLFLRLVICLNSAGNLDRLEANKKGFERFPQQSSREPSHPTPHKLPAHQSVSNGWRKPRGAFARRARSSHFTRHIA